MKYSQTNETELPMSEKEEKKIDKVFVNKSHVNFRHNLVIFNTKFYFSATQNAKNLFLCIFIFLFLFLVLLQLLNFFIFCFNRTHFSFTFRSLCVWTAWILVGWTFSLQKMIIEKCIFWEHSKKSRAKNSMSCMYLYNKSSFLSSFLQSWLSWNYFCLWHFVP